MLGFFSCVFYFTDLQTNSQAALFYVRAEVRGEAQSVLLRVANPAFLIPQVGQIPAANGLLELPQVTPQLEILQEGKQTKTN